MLLTVNANVSLTKQQILLGISDERHFFKKKESMDRTRVKAQAIALLMRMKKISGGGKK